jgi:hypothetical protein
VTPRRAVRVIVVAVAVVFLVVRFAAIDATSHSASDTLRPWFIETALVVVIAWLVVRAADALLARRGRPD